MGVNASPTSSPRCGVKTTQFDLKLTGRQALLFLTIETCLLEIRLLVGDDGRAESSAA